MLKLVKHPTLNFASGHELLVHEIELTVQSLLEIHSLSQNEQNKSPPWRIEGLAASLLGTQ